MHWMYTGGNVKSAAELDRLVSEVLLADNFDVRHFCDSFSVQHEECRMENGERSADETKSLPGADGWRTVSVKLRIPKKKECHHSEEDAPEIEVDGLYYRLLVEVIRVAFEDPSAKHFEFTPHELRFCDDNADDPSDEGERIFTEAYTCDAILEEDKKIQSLPRNPDDSPDVPYAIAALMLWSDSTHLANFGSASLWPIYLFFGNLSKYVHCKLSTFSAHHLAYIPSVSIHVLLNILDI